MTVATGKRMNILNYEVNATRWPVLPSRLTPVDAEKLEHPNRKQRRAITKLKGRPSKADREAGP
jgi:hypothetical protein